MEQALVLHPAIHRPRKGDIIIQLTDIQLHTNARITQSAGKAIERSIESNQPGRIFSPVSRMATALEDNAVVFSIPIFNPDDLKPMIQHYQNLGQRVFLAKPNKGLPVLPGKDTIEFINSKKGKRVLRKLEKDQQVG